MSDFVGDVLGGIGDLFEGAFDLVGDLLEGVVDVIGDALEFVGNTVQAIIKDPLPTLLQIGGSFIGIPPYVTAAVITAAKGGDLEDIALSAAVSYASTELLSNTQLGADIKNYTVNQFSGDFTDTMMENFNLTADQAVQISRVATASLNSSLVGGINAALSGRSVIDGITSGFTSGLVYSSTDSYFDSLNKDPNWGFSPQALNLMKGATSTALNTIVSGKGDPAQAVGNYIAYAAINLGTSKILQSAKDAYKVFMTNTDEAEAAQDKYTTIKADYDSKVVSGEKLRNEINAGADDYKKIIDNQFTPFKNSYDEVVGRRDAEINAYNWEKSRFEENKNAYNNYDQHLRNLGFTYYAGDSENGTPSFYAKPSAFETRTSSDEGGSFTYQVVTAYEYPPTQGEYLNNANAAAAAANAAAGRANTANTEAQTLITNNQAMLDSLETKRTEIETKQKAFDVIKLDVEAPNADGTNTAAKLKDAANTYQTKYEAWSKTKDAADRSAENYTKALAEVATRDALIDTLNTGALKVTSKDAEGNWTLSNGMTLTTQGKFIQDGVQVFSNAAGIPQKVMDFKANDGTNVEFNDDAGRMLSETDAATIAKRDFGIVLTPEEAANLSDGVYTDKVTNPINELANKKARDTYFEASGKEPTASELEQFRKSGNVLNSAADAAINGLDLPPDYVSPGASVAQKVSFGQAYAAARLAYGNGAVFDWNGKQYTTENKQEQTTRLDKYLDDAQNRINLMPANEVAGAGRGFFGGPPAGVENIYYGSKDDNVYVDTRTFDAMGRQTGGSLRLADDKTATNIRATNIIEQIAATGAQGFGDLMQSYASAVSLGSGSDMNSVVYRLGKTLEQWGKDRDGSDVAAQTKNMETAVQAASKESNFFKQGQMIIQAAKDNPIGMISFFGKEIVQETPGWAMGALGAAGVLAFGGSVGAVALTAAGFAAAVDGLESFGAGGREAYDALKKAGVPEDQARDKAIINGGIHAAVTIPAEFIADKALFSVYLKGVSGGVKEYAAKYGSTIATNAVSEFIETVPQVLSTQQITTGKTDLKSATAEAWFSSIIGAGTATMVLGPAAINDAAIVAKDYSGRDVSLADFISGTRDVDLGTLDSSATIGTLANGGQMTVGSLAAVGTDLGLTNTELTSILPPSIAGYSSVVYKAADGTTITLGNINSIVGKNPTLDFTTVLDTVYKTNSADFKVVFSPSVLNGTAALKPAVDYETMALSQGFPSYAVYQQHSGDIKLYQNAQNVNLAVAAGFPDFAQYSKFNGDSAAYNASKAPPPIATPPAAPATPSDVTSPAITPPVGAPTLEAVDVAPQVQAPIIEAPPAVTLPVVATPVVTPPVVDLPVITSPVVELPVELPATVTPPVETPPEVTPPVVTPPVVTPPVVTPPVVTPPTVTPPAGGTAFDTALAGMDAANRVKFETLTQGQKDIVAAQVKMGTDINAAITNAATQTATQIAGVKTDISNLSADVQTKFNGLTQGQKDIVDAQVKMGVDINKAIDDAAKQTAEKIDVVKTDLTKNITDVQTQFNTRVDELVLQGKTYQEATQTALSELDKGVTSLGEGVADLQKKEEEAAAAREREAANRRSAQAQAKSRRNLGEAMSLIAPAAAVAGNDDTPYRQIGLKTTGEAKFEGPLEQYLKMVKENTYAPKPAQTDTQQQQVAPVQDELSKPQQQPQENNYFNYGQTSEIDQLLGDDPGTGMLFSKAGGLATPLFAAGGNTRTGRYSGGGLDIVHHAGKPRQDFRKGDAVTGPGDGQSDDIPAMLADGEFVFPADVVAALGNGSTKAGSDKLYDMMHSIRAYHRAAKPKDLPPPAKKSPLDYLKKPASKARR